MELTAELTKTEAQVSRLIALVMLDVLFLSVIVVVSNQATVKAFTPLFLVELVLASLRLAHAVSYNAIFEWVRAPFTEVKQDSCGAGANVHPKGTGAWAVIGELLSCPICSGTWAALTLTALATVTPAGVFLVHVLAVAGGYELVHRLSEKWEWEGRRSRVVSGKISPDS